MTRHHLPWSLGLAILLLLTGCTTAPDIKPEDVYQPPRPGAPAAWVNGVNISEAGLFGSEHRGFVFMVDLQAIEDAASNWNKPVALMPGAHSIGVEYQYSNFKARAYMALVAQAGVTYQLRIKPGRENPPNGQQFTDFWIVDQSTGIPVTQIYRRDLMGGKQGTIFYMNK